MPGLLRGVGRTAAVAGTATAVAGRVRRRQEGKWAEQDAAAQETAQPPASSASTPSTIDQLKQLGELKDKGVLTEQEFADQKAKLLAG